MESTGETKRPKVPLPTENHQLTVRIYLISHSLLKNKIIIFKDIDRIFISVFYLEISDVISQEISNKSVFWGCFLTR